MIDDEAFYRQLNSVLPQKVRRLEAESNYKAGEVEFAIAALLDEAYASGVLNEKIIEWVQANYEDGPVADMLAALDQLSSSVT